MFLSNPNLLFDILSKPLSKCKTPATAYSATPSELSGVFVTNMLSGRLNLPIPVLERCTHFKLGITSRCCCVILSPQYTSASGLIIVVILTLHWFSTILTISSVNV